MFKNQFSTEREIYQHACKKSCTECFFKSKGFFFFFYLEGFWCIELATVLFNGWCADAQAFCSQKLHCCSLPEFSYFFKQTKRGTQSSTAGRLPINKRCTHPWLKNRKSIHFIASRHYRRVYIPFCTFSHPISSLLLLVSFTFCTICCPLDEVKME